MKITVSCEVVHDGSVERKSSRQVLSEQIVTLLQLQPMMLMMMIDRRHNIVSCTLWRLDKKCSWHRQHVCVIQWKQRSVEPVTDVVTWHFDVLLPTNLCNADMLYKSMSCAGDEPSWQMTWLTTAATNRHASSISAPCFHLTAAHHTHRQTQIHVTLDFTLCLDASSHCSYVFPDNFVFKLLCYELHSFA